MQVSATIERLDGRVEDMDLPVRVSYETAIDCAYAYFDNNEDIRAITVVVTDVDGNDRMRYTVC